MPRLVGLSLLASLASSAHVHHASMAHKEPTPAGAGVQLSASASEAMKELKAKRAQVKARGDFLWDSANEMITIENGRQYKIWKMKNSAALLYEVGHKNSVKCDGAGKKCVFMPNAQCEGLKKLTKMHGAKARFPNCLEDHGYRSKDPFIVVEGGRETVQDWALMWWKNKLPAEPFWAMVQQLLEGIEQLGDSKMKHTTYDLIVGKTGLKYIDVEPTTVYDVPSCTGPAISLSKFVDEVTVGLTKGLNVTSAQLMDVIKQKSRDSNHFRSIFTMFTHTKSMANAHACPKVLMEILKMENRFKTEESLENIFEVFEANYTKEEQLALLLAPINT